MPCVCPSIASQPPWPKKGHAGIEQNYESQEKILEMEAARHHTPQKREDMIIKILCGGKQQALLVPTVILLDAGEWKAISRRNSASSFSWKGSSKYERYDLKKTSFHI